MARKWIVLWSAIILWMGFAIAVVLLWKLSDVQGSQPAVDLPISAMFSQKDSASAGDQLAHPPLSQSFATGDYRFEVTASDQWQTPSTVGQLYKSGRLLWEKTLPQQYGPRFVVVGSQGQVLLIDEFINVASPYALMLLDVVGEPIATYSFEDIQQVLSVSAAELTSQATSGWWVSDAPQRVQNAAAQSNESITTHVILIPAGGTRLAVNLLTGELINYQDL